VSDVELETLLRALAAEFKRREMTQHLELLRVLYRRYRAAKTRAALAPKPVWEIDVVLQWLAMLHIPPFESVFRELPSGAPCPRCTEVKDPMSASFTRAAFHGATLLECMRCGQCWLVTTAMREGPAG
jgi:hypothetical protein